MRWYGKLARFDRYADSQGLRLLALGLGLPDDTFLKLHGFDSVGETYGERVALIVTIPVFNTNAVRFMK